jgi:radical SAM protein with 4Fe4S-binding SPASM domain
MEKYQKPKYKQVFLSLTHACDSNCSFCYRRGLYQRHKLSELGDYHMKEDTALKILEFVFTNLDLHPDFCIYFWGGEAILNMNVIKRVLKEFPQFSYHLATNGGTFDEEKYNYFKQHRDVSITWSLGNAYEKFGGIKQKVEAQLWIAKFIKESGDNIEKSGVNFMVTNFDNFFDDFVYLENNLTPLITLDIATRCNYNQEDLDKFASEYIRLIEYYKKIDNKVLLVLNPIYKSNLWLREFGPKTLARDYQYCRSGLERLYFDTNGGIWQCDCWYVNQYNKLGDIQTGLDKTKLQLMIDVDLNRDKYLGQGCQDCEINHFCPRNKCLGLNMETTGSLFMPDKSWCAMCKVIYKVALHYIELEKNKRELEIDNFNAVLEKWKGRKYGRTTDICIS